jgi:hypothetical protein
MSQYQFLLVLGAPISTHLSPLIISISHLGAYTSLDKRSAEKMTIIVELGKEIK